MVVSVGPPHTEDERFLEQLRRSTLLGGLEESVLRRLVPAVGRKALAAGDVLFEKDEPADALYVVLTGELEATRRQEDGTLMVLARMGPGSTVGEIQILTGGTRTATVRAAADSHVACLPKSQVDALGAKHPEVLEQIASVIRERLRRDQLVAVLPRLFGRADEEILRDAEAAIEWVHLKRGDRLFGKGEVGDSVYFNVSGRLGVVVGEDDGNPHVVAEVARGEFVGEMALFTGEERSASVYAIRDSDLARIDATSFEHLVQQHPRLLRAITSTLVRRLQDRAAPSAGAKPVANIAVVPLSRNVPLQAFTSRLVAALAPFENTVHLSSRNIDEQPALKGAAELPEDSPYGIRLRAWLDQLEADNRFVIYEADAGDSTWTRRAIRQADQVLLVGRACDPPGPSEIERAVMQQESHVTSPRQRLILLHPDGTTRPSGTRHWLCERKVEMHHHLRWDRDDDFMRLGRFLRGAAMGLALSGGGARGMSHIGVIRALLDQNIPIDMIAGTSAGGVIATQFAYGMDPDTMEDRNREAFVKNKPFHELHIPIVSMLGSTRMNRLARWMYGPDTRIEDLWLPCFCVSTNLSTSERVLHRSGVVWRAVRASSALPGISVPVIDDNRVLVDGGVVDNLPGPALQDISGGPVIVVDVSPDEPLVVDFAEIPSGAKILWSWLAPHRKKIEVPTIGHVILRTAVITSVKARRLARERAILMLRPPVERFNLLEFSAFDDIVKTGYDYAMTALGDWPERAQYALDSVTETGSG